MIAALIIAILFSGSLSALLPRWRQVAIGVLCTLGLLVVVVAYLLHDLGQHPSGGDGPAFFGLAFLAGLFQGIVLASVLGRVFVDWLATKLSPVARKRVVATVLGLSVTPLVLVGLFAFAEPGVTTLLGMATIVALPGAWMAAALRLAPAHATAPGLLPG